MENNKKFDGTFFFVNGLCVHSNLAQDELNYFSDFHSATEAAWTKKDSELQKDLNKVLEKYPKEHHGEICDSHGWELHLNQYKYPNMHRESFIITIHNFLEHQLNELCKILSQSIDSKIQLKNLHGQGIERAFLYLSKVAELDLSKMGKERPYIKSVCSLRNQIVHNGGKLPVDPESKLNKFVLENPHLHGAPENHVSVAPKFINELIDLLISFFKKLDIEIQAHIQKSINS